MRKVFAKFGDLPRALKRAFSGGGKRNILHFFLAFTGLFLILTGIILQVSRAGMYTSTDRELEVQASNTDMLLKRGSTILITLDPSDSNDEEGSTFMPDTRNFGSFTVIYDENGKVLNGDLDLMAKAIDNANLKMDEHYIKTIGTIEIGDEPYRTIIIPVKSVLLVNGGRPAYIQLFQSVKQIRQIIASTSWTIQITMFIFWFLSLFVSIYLSRISLRPLEIALERQKAFVSNASHELRTPLTIMQNRLQLLFQNPSATIIDESENISASLNEVRNMRALTSNLLNMAKSDGSVNIEPVETDEKFFQEIFENFEILAHEQGRFFDSSVQFDGVAQLDQGLIKQVLTILFDNAVKYTCEHGTITAEVSKQRNELLLIVSDDGLGISNMDKKRIFDRFYRVDESRTRGKGGLGLGLSLANEIVRAMKGRITVEDNKPGGTKFTVKLKL